ATTNRPANAAPAVPAKARSGSTTRSKKQRWPPPERTAATCKPSTAVYAPGSGTAKRSAPSNTRSSQPAGTCSQPASPTARPAAPTHSTATSKKPSAASSNNSKRSATTSHSNRSPLNQHRFSHQVPQTNLLLAAVSFRQGDRRLPVQPVP